MDVPLEAAIRSRFDQSTVIEVSILVLVDVPLEVLVYYIRFQFRILVSILVLVDVPLEGRRNHMTAKLRFESFNPCSRGCSARSRVRRDTEQAMNNSFNPCSRGCSARSVFGVDGTSNTT